MKNQIGSKSGHMLNLTRRLLDSTKEALGSVGVKVKPGDLAGDEIYKVFLHMYTKIAWQLAFGAYYCCRYGFGIAGIGAARSIYEMFITIRYIEQDKDSRLKRFFDHTDVIRKLEIDALTLSRERVPGKVLKHQISEFNRVKKKYQKAKPPFKKLWWAGINVEGMAKEIGWTKNHTLIYGKLSTIAHVCITELDAHLKHAGNSQEEIQIQSELTPDPKYDGYVLSVILGYFPEILNSCLKAWDIELSHALKQIYDEIQST